MSTTAARLTCHTGQGFGSSPAPQCGQVCSRPLARRPHTLQRICFILAGFVCPHCGQTSQSGLTGSEQLMQVDSVDIRKGWPNLSPGWDY
jgi:hypothetical protein